MYQGRTIGGFICSLLGIISYFIFGKVISIVLGIVGLCLSISAKNRLKTESQPTGLASAGMALGIITICLVIISFLLGLSFLSSLLWFL